MSDDLKLKVNKQKGPTIVGFFSALLSSVLQAHVFHLQTQSYAQHIALGSYYDTVDGLTDGLIEAYQGKYGIVKGYECPKLQDISNPVAYFRQLHTTVEQGASLFTDSDLKNTIDEIKSLIKSTLYKLENLK